MPAPVCVVCIASGPSLQPTERAALRLAALSAPGAVVAVGVGADTPPAALAAACGAGATRAVWLRDPLLPRSGPLGQGRALGHLARHLGAALVLLGARADDEALGLLPAAIAHELSAPCFARIDDLLREGEDPRFVAHLRSGGRRVRVRLPSPAVVGVGFAAVVDAAAAPAGERAVIETLSLEDVGLNPVLLPRSTDWLGRLVAKDRDRKPRALADAAELEALLRTRLSR